MGKDVNLVKFLKMSAVVHFSPQHLDDPNPFEMWSDMEDIVKDTKMEKDWQLTKIRRSTNNKSSRTGKTKS